MVVGDYFIVTLYPTTESKQVYSNFEFRDFVLDLWGSVQNCFEDLRITFSFVGFISILL